MRGLIQAIRDVLTVRGGAGFTRTARVAAAADPTLPPLARLLLLAPELSGRTTGESGWAGEGR
ncbi:hypothetical protein GCM10022379_45030 [Micromonospora maritima]